MDTSGDTLLNALKMMGVTDPATAKNVRLVETLAAMKDGPTPKAMMSLLSQINPKYAPYVAMLNSMDQLQQKAQTENEKETTSEAKQEPFVQYNHPDD